MKILIPLFVVIVILSSCRKTESDSGWEKSFGKGEALFMTATPDSGFAACGHMDGNPYFIRFSSKMSKLIDFTSDNPGLFSSVWFDTSGYVTAGNTEGRMLLMRHSAEGTMLWEKTFDAGFFIDYTRLNYLGDGTLLALGTASPDSSGSGSTGLVFVRFDTTGQVLEENTLTENSFVAAKDFSTDNSGNIYIALTRKYTGSESKASVARYNNLFQKMWETELSNNPAFGASSNAILLDGSGTVYVAGATELSTEGDILQNSFLVSLNTTGSVNWKKYLENSNSGVDLILNDNDELLLLHKNCFIVNGVSTADGSLLERIRFFSVCDPYQTDIFGHDMDICYDKQFLISGSKGGNFYLALKSPQ